MSTLITQELARAHQVEMVRELERAAAVRRAIAERESDAQPSQRVGYRLRERLGHFAGAAPRTHHAVQV